MKERANTALANLQRNSYALSVLRSRMESRINFISNGKSSSKNEDCQELAKVLDLVRHGEMVLNELSERIEAARFLEEFVSIIENATLSVREIKDDVEMLVPEAEEAIREMNDAVSKIRIKMNLSELGDADDQLGREIQDGILIDVAMEISRKAEEREKLQQLLGNVQQQQQGQKATEIGDGTNNILQTNGEGQQHEKKAFAEVSEDQQKEDATA